MHLFATLNYKQRINEVLEPTKQANFVIMYDLCE